MMLLTQQLKKMKNSRTIIPAAVVACAALTFNAQVQASPCYNKAVQRYNKARVTLSAPYNFAQAIYAGKKPVNCSINSLNLTEYALKLSCEDGYKYEIGTTGYCGRGGAPNCEKAVVTNPSGQKSYHKIMHLGKDESCIGAGAQLSIQNKILLGNKDVLIITSHQFKE